MGCGLADSAVHLAWMVHHVLEAIRGPDQALWSFCRLLSPTASRGPWSILLLHYCYLPIAVLDIQLLIPPLVKISVVVFEVGGGVVEVVVALHLAPLASIGTGGSC